jgi:Ring finger domain
MDSNVNVANCPICLESLFGADSSSDDVGMTVPCAHCFHVPCFRQWTSSISFQDSPTTCPMCRAVIKYMFKADPTPVDFGNNDNVNDGTEEVPRTMATEPTEIGEGEEDSVSTGSSTRHEDILETAPYAQERIFDIDSDSDSDTNSHIRMQATDEHEVRFQRESVGVTPSLPNSKIYLHIEGAGSKVVNGFYEQQGFFEGVAKYVRYGLDSIDDQLLQVIIYRCRVNNDLHRWYVSSTPIVVNHNDTKTDYYTSPVTESKMTSPPINNWSVTGLGILPLPRMSFRVPFSLTNNSGIFWPYS